MNIFHRMMEDQNDNHEACTIVQALSGYGKTYIFRELVEKDPKSFYQCLDISDCEPGHFLKKIEDVWEIIDEATMDKVGSSDDKTMWERIDDLVERVYHWSDRYTLVLDDFQMITSDQIIDLLAFLVGRTSDYIRFVILTDDVIPAQFRKMIRTDSATLITEKDLKLTKDSDISEGEKKLIKPFLGWPYGIAKAAKYIENKSKKNIDLHILLRDSGLGADIEDIMWNPLSDEMKTLLATTSILDEFSWELCVAVMDGGIKRRDFEQMISSENMIERIRGQAMSNGRSSGDEWYRFGDIYATFLRERISESEKKDIYCRAAEWYRQVGDHAGMVGYAIKGRQTELLVDVIEKQGTRMLAGRQALGMIIHYLEEEGVRFDAVSAGIAGQYYYAEGNMGRMEEYLNLADASFGKENRYSAYRSIYRALSRYDADPDRYEKQLRSALFFLKENSEPMPWLKPEAEKRLERMLHAGEKGERSLKAECLGSFRVIAERDEKEIAWRTKKGRELFAYLTDLRGESVDRRRLMEVLWPEEIPTNAVAMLHNMIYNIRKELANYDLDGLLVYENKRYRLYTEELNNTADTLFEIAEAVEHSDMDTLMSKKEFFTDLPGRYLEDVDAAWADERREYYDRIYLRGCDLLAKKFTEDNKIKDAIRLYENIHKLDPYDEDSVEQILLLYGREREWDSMKRCYDSFCKKLKDELGIEPGDAVTEAYRKGKSA